MKKKVLLIGDVMLDINTYGECKRISPEAPVQVVKKTHTSATLGGAGNNLVNMYHLNLPVTFVTVAGNDNNALEVERLASQYYKSDLIIKENGRKTTIKNRILANHHQVLRIDEEDNYDILPESLKKIVNFVENEIANTEIIMFSDYNKGVCSKELIRSIIKIANKNNVITICDPKKNDIEIYRGLDIIKPNRSEAEALCGFVIKNHHDIEKALLLLKQYVKKPVITLSEDGIAFLDDSNCVKYSKSIVKDVVDVTGAGDTVISTICYGIYNKIDFAKTIDLANKAASIVVEKFGTSFVSEYELLNESSKFLKNTEEFLQKIDKNKKIVFTNGCFDVIHLGHIKYLQEAKKLGDILVIGLNSDESIKRLKGNSRPINNLEARAEVLSALSCVDFIIPFWDDTPINLIKDITPDVLVKGGDYEIKNIVGNDIAKSTVVLQFIDGYSTSNIIKKMKLS